MTVYLIRHAHAVGRRRWAGPDVDRPLDERGRRQAEGLVRWFATRPVDVVYTSPASRCIDTVRAVAAGRGLPLEAVDALGECHGDAAAALVDTADHVVLCSHGDNLPVLLLTLAGHVDGVDDDPPFAKGAVWLLERGADRKVVGATYVEAPA